MSQAPSNRRLLLASQLRIAALRAQLLSLDVVAMVRDPTYARETAIHLKRVGDAPMRALVREYVKLSRQEGVWEDSPPPPETNYSTLPDGMLPAAAAWDPTFQPPETQGASAPPAPERAPTLSTRDPGLVAPRASLASRFGFSKPASDPASQPASDMAGQPSQPPSSLAGAKTGSPQNPQHKKYTGGIR
jgi:hypothetical protein